MFAAAQPGEKGTQHEQRRERFGYPGDVGDGLDVNGVQSEHQRARSRHPFVPREPEAQAEDEVGHRQVRRHRSEMPSPGAQTKKHFVQA